MVKNYIDVLKKYADVTGRARRREFWLFFLANLIIIGIPYFLLMVIIAAAIENGGDEVTALNIIIPIIYLVLFLYQLAIFLPNICVGVRRLHDIGRSGWWLLVHFVPFIGPIILIVWFAQDSEPDSNQYGPYPK
jgi:uncharacterized membrane protein YhaH (DUF805 family)